MKYQLEMDYGRWESILYRNTRNKHSYQLRHKLCSGFGERQHKVTRLCYEGLKKSDYSRYGWICACKPPEEVLKKHKELCKLARLIQKLKV